MRRLSTSQRLILTRSRFPRLERAVWIFFGCYILCDWHAETRRVRKVADAQSGFVQFRRCLYRKYDFFSRVFEHLLKGFNNAGGGKYAEYYTPRAIAQVMARLLVGDNAELRGVTCYDPSAGTGTLLMALAHQIGEDRCTIYSQDISENPVRCSDSIWFLTTSRLRSQT